MVVWGCWTTKGWRDEGNPNPEIQGLKHILVLEGIGTLPNKRSPKYIIFYPIYSSNYDIYLRETGYMGIIQQNIVQV